MIWNDTSTRDGLVQDMEDTCGLGATGITGNSNLFAMFTRWANDWNKKGSAIALNAMDGWDFDDPSYTTKQSGTFAGTTNRDYNFDSALKLLKIKSVGMTYDGTNYVKADPIDSLEFQNVKKDPNIDQTFNQAKPKYDPISGGIEIYPKFTTAQVAAGAKVYVEFFREPQSFAVTGTDSQVPGFASPFHRIISLGGSYEYCKLYKPDLARDLAIDLFGGVKGGARISGMKADMEEWYSNRYPHPKVIRPKMRSSR